jgi:hypothetical protein
MVGSNLTILDQIAIFLLLLSEAPSYWFTLNTSCDHAFHLLKWLGMDESNYKALLTTSPVTIENLPDRDFRTGSQQAANKQPTSSQQVPNDFCAF